MEQANGGMKKKAAFFDRRVRMDQIGLADLIFRSSYLMMNFRLPFIQGRDGSMKHSDGRPCKAEIRWFGGIDDGLVDIREEVDLWGMDAEVALWHELWEKHPDKSKLAISKMVLDANLPEKYGREHREKFLL